MNAIIFFAQKEMVQLGVESQRIQGLIGYMVYIKGIYICEIMDTGCSRNNCGQRAMYNQAESSQSPAN